MVENPYDSPTTTDGAPKPPTQSTRTLVYSGIGCLVAALGAVVAMAIRMTTAFRSIATSDAAPKPSDLADGIGQGALFVVAAISLAILGLVLLVAGFLIRRPRR